MEADLDDTISELEAKNTMPKPLSRRNTACDTLTISPGDSITTVGGPVQRTRGNTIGSNFDAVVHGYSQDGEQRAEEAESYKQIREVSGCPIILSDQRLNFLINLHKHLYNILSDNDTYPSVNSLDRLVRFMGETSGKRRSAHVELLYQVIKSTISFTGLYIKANPFNLPIIEVGMEIGDRIIMMCFDKLHDEFETRWFSVMKDVEPPKFHSKYNQFSNENYPTRDEPRRSPRYKERSSRSGSLVNTRLADDRRPHLPKRNQSSSSTGSIFSGKH
jgi:hypothetical protein